MTVLRAGDQANSTFEEQGARDLAAPKTRDWPELVLDFLLQAGLLVGLAAVSFWLWPAGLLDKPLDLIKLSDWLWAAGAVWVGMLCVLLLYFVVVEPVIGSIKNTEGSKD